MGKRVFAEALAAYVLIDGNLRHEGLFKAGSHPDFYVIRPEDLVANPTDNDSSAFALSNQYALRLIPQAQRKTKKRHQYRPNTHAGSVIEYPTLILLRTE